MVRLFSVLTRFVDEFVNVPRGAMPVTVALTTGLLSSVSPAGLKNMPEASSHGDATPAPARPIEQAPCSYTPKPCATADALTPQKTATSGATMKVPTTRFVCLTALSPHTRRRLSSRPRVHPLDRRVEVKMNQYTTVTAELDRSVCGGITA